MTNIKKTTTTIMEEETKDGKDNCQSSTVNCQSIRPCPRLFPSFTVGEGEAERYEEIRALVARDRYLPPGYRRNGGVKGGEWGRVVADPRRYVSEGSVCRMPKTEAELIAEFARQPVLRTDLLTGETVEYATAAECATLNCRSVPTLYRQVRHTSIRARYKFETID